MTSVPAGAAANTATFCKDVATVTKVPSPRLPTSSAHSAIANAVALLPTDITTLNKLHARLVAGAEVAPSSSLANTYRVAATQVNNKSSDVTRIIKDERAVLTSPKSYSAELALVTDLISATSAAATANAYFAANHASIVKACR